MTGRDGTRHDETRCNVMRPDGTRQDNSFNGVKDMETKRKAINELHTDTRILMNLLTVKLVKENADIVKYDELSAAIARDVRDGARGLLGTARKHVEQDNQIALETVRSVGIKRTRDYSGMGDKTISQIRRNAARTTKRMLRASVNDTLDDEAQARVASRLSMLGLFGLFTRRVSLNRLEAKVREIGNKELPTAETLRLFEK